MLAAKAGSKTLLLNFASSPSRTELGGAAGLCRTIRLEHPGTEAYSISIADDRNPGSLASKIMQAISLSDSIEAGSVLIAHCRRSPPSTGKTSAN